MRSLAKTVCTAAVFLTVLTVSVSAWYPPSLTYAGYDQKNGKLTLRFDQDIDTFNNTYGTISLFDGTNEAMLVTPLSSSPGWRQLTVILAAAEAADLDTWPNAPNGLQVTMGAEIVKNLYGDFNQQQTMAVDYHPQFKIVGAAYDAAYNTVQLAFNRALNDSATNTAVGLDLWTDEGRKITIQSPWEYTTGEYLNDGVLTVQVDSTNALLIESWNSVNDSLHMTVQKDVFFGIDVFDTIPLSDSIPVEYIPSVKILEARYSTIQDKITLVFSDSLRDSLQNGYATIMVSVDDGGIQTDTLSTYAYHTGSIADDDTMEIHLSAEDALEIESWTGIDNSLELSVAAGTFIDFSTTRSNEDIHFAMDCALHVDRPVKIIGASYVPEENMLSLVFDQPVRDAGIDNTRAVTLSDDNGATFLTLGAPWAFMTGTAPDDDTIHINMTNIEAVELEAFPSVTSSLECALESGVFYSFQGNSPNDTVTFNDNIAVVWEPLPMGAVGQWSFSEERGTIALDSSGYGNNAYLQGGAVFHTDMNGVSLNGTDGYITVNDSVGLDNLYQMTVSMWVKRNRAGVDEYLLMKGATHPAYLLFIKNTGQLHLNLSSSGSSGWEFGVSSAAVLDTGVWHHVAAVFRSSAVDIYIDGTLDVTTPHSLPSIASTGEQVYIGSDYGLSAPLYGSIGHTALYNDSLNATRIDSLFQAQKPAYFVEEVTPPANDLSPSVQVIDTQQVHIEWSSYVGEPSDADSIGVWWATDTFPQYPHAPNAAGYKMYPFTGTYQSDTISLEAGGQTYFFSVAVRDSSGNWSSITETNQVRAFVPAYHGPIWYVNAALSGTATGSVGAPFTNVHQVMPYLEVGDTIRIAAGNYVLESTLYFNRDSVVIEGAYSSDYSKRDADMLSSNFVAGAQLDGPMMSVATAMPGLFRIDGITFENHFGSFIEISSGTQENTLLTNNRFINCGAAAVDLAMAANVYVKNNIFARCSTGIFAQLGTSLLIENNTFFGNYRAVQWGDFQGGVFRNNIVSYGQYGLQENTTTAMLDSLQYNSFYGLQAPCLSPGGDAISLDQLNMRSGAMDNLSLEPRFIDTAKTAMDLRLKNSSPCIDAGDPHSPYAGEPLPNGQRINLGAYGNTAHASILDVYPPQNSYILDITVIDTGRMQITWYADPVPVDADSIGIWYKGSGFPKDAFDEAAMLLGKYGLEEKIDTLNVNAGAKVYVSLSLVDKAGNWASFTPAAQDSATSYVAAPVITTAEKVVAREYAAVTWANPASLTPDDSIFVHIDTVTAAYGWKLHKTLPYNQTRANLWFGAEGSYLYMISTSRDSAGVRELNGVAQDTITLNIPPIVGTTVSKRVAGLSGVISWTPLDWLSSTDSVYVHYDSVDGRGGWRLAQTLAYDMSACVLTVGQPGSYKYMVSTSRDSAGSFDASNALVDTMVFEFQENPTSWYVDVNAAQTGGDGSLGKPFISLKNAFGIVDYGDTIHVAQGVYQVRDNADTIAPNLVLLGGYKTGFLGRDPYAHKTIIDGGDSLFGVFMNVRQGTEIDGFTFQRIQSTCLNVFYTSHVKITRSYFKDCATAIRIENSDSVLVSNNIISGCGLGIHTVNDKGLQVVLRNNTIVKSSGYGLLVSGPLAEMKNGIFAFNVVAYRQVYGSPSQVLYNCFYQNNMDYELVEYTETRDVNDMNTWQGSGGNIGLSPSFVDTLDYRLSIGSPCIDAGDVTSPYHNEPLPNGSRVNMGAYGNTAQATISMENQLVPENKVALSIQALGDTGLTFSVSIPASESGKVKHVGVGISYGTAQRDIMQFLLLPPVDTTLQKITLDQPGWWYVSWATIDTVGNLSHINVDSIKIGGGGNHAPVIDSISMPDSVFVGKQYQIQVFVNDFDGNADSITAKALDSPPVDIAVERLKETQWLITVSATPTDTGYQQISIQCSDQSAATVVEKMTIYVLKVTGVPETKLVGKNHKSEWGAVSYRMENISNADVIVSFKGVLTDIKRSVHDTVVSTTGQFSWHPLTDGEYVFQCAAFDTENRYDETPYVDTFTISGATNYTFTDTGEWQMISAPAKSHDAAILKSAGHLLHWDETREEDDTYRYYVRSSEISSLRAGEGYWFKGKKSVSMSLKKESFEGDSATVHLSHGGFGWNQVASPYPFPVKWPGTSAVWLWNTDLGDYQESNNVLEPWKAYWVHTNQTDSVVLHPEPVFDREPLAKKKKTFFTSRDDWRIQLKLSAGEYRDFDNIIGFSPRADNGKDEMDKAEPPRMAKYPCLYINRPDWNSSFPQYASDIRRVFEKDDVEAFQLCMLPGEESVASMQLTLEGVSDLKDVYLFYGDQSSMVAITADTTIALSKQSSPLYKTLFVTPNSRFLNQIPQQFNMGLPYPNPARPRVVLNYQLPYRWYADGRLNGEDYLVRMNIYDVRGRIVRQLINRPQKPGFHKSIWDGKSNTGRLVAAGTYFCRLDAGDYKGLKRVTILR